jgi:Domain of unknown function (DUF6306)
MPWDALNNMLMLPSRDPALAARGAPGLERTGQTGCRPVAAHSLSGFFARKPGKDKHKVIAFKEPDQRLDLLNRGQGWGVHKLREALLRIDESALHRKSGGTGGCQPCRGAGDSSMEGHYFRERLADPIVPAVMTGDGTTRGEVEILIAAVRSRLTKAYSIEAGRSIVVTDHDVYRRHR